MIGFNETRDGNRNAIEVDESEHVGCLPFTTNSRKFRLGYIIKSGSVRTGIAKHHGRYSISDHLCQASED